MSGAWVFRGTRVQVKALFENLEDGATIDQFMEWFPSVSRDQALAVLDSLKQASLLPSKRCEFSSLLGTPAPLRPFLAGHEVKTAFELRWAELSNGELLARAEPECDVLVTTDQQLGYQHNLTRSENSSVGPAQCQLD